MKTTACGTIRTCVVMSFLLLLFGYFNVLQVFAEGPAIKPIKQESILIAISPTNIANSRAIGELTKTEEWKSFCPLFVAKLDESYQKAKSSPDFPKEIDQWFQKTVGGALNKKEVTSKDLIEALFEHVNAVVFIGAPEEINEITQKNGAFGAIVLVVDFNPMEFQGILDFAKKDVHYKTLDEKKDSLSLASIDDKAFLSVTRWNNSGKYLVAFSSTQDQITKSLDSFKKVSDPDTYLKESKNVLVLVELPSQLLEKLRAQLKNENDGKKRDAQRVVLGILEKIESVSFRIYEEGGKKLARLNVSTTSKENAEELRRMADGGLAFLSFITAGIELKSEEKLVMNIANNIAPTCQDSDYVMTLTLDESVLELVKKILKDAADKM